MDKDSGHVVRERTRDNSKLMKMIRIALSDYIHMLRDGKLTVMGCFQVPDHGRKVLRKELSKLAKVNTYPQVADGHPAK